VNGPGFNVLYQSLNYYMGIVLLFGALILNHGEVWDIGISCVTQYFRNTSYNDTLKYHRYTDS
jgi:hypothetical protein